MRTSKRLVLGLLASITLSGCAHTITVSCLTRKQYEDLKAQQPGKIHGKLTGKADEDIRPVAGSALRLRAYSDTLLGVLEVCAH